MFDDGYASRVGKYREKNPWDHYDDPLFAQKFAKHQKKFPGAGNIPGVHMLARASFEAQAANADAGNFVGNAPARLERDVDDARPDRAPVAGHVPSGSQPAAGGGGPLSDEDFFQQVFAGAGEPVQGQGDEGQMEEGAEGRGPRMGGWARTGSFFKGVGNLLTLPLMSLGALGAAGVHRVRRWWTGRTARQLQNPAMRANLDEQGRKALSARIAKNDIAHQMAQRSLGTARRLYTGRSMVDHFAEAFKGRTMRVADSRKAFFSGGQFGRDPDDEVAAS